MPSNVYVPEIVLEDVAAVKEPSAEKVAVIAASLIACAF